MKVKTSVTLDKTVLKQISALRGERSRSEFIENAVTDQIRRLHKEARDRREISLINKNSKYLNEEAEDALSYQVKL